MPRMRRFLGRSSRLICHTAPACAAAVAVILVVLQLQQSVAATASVAAALPCIDAQRNDAYQIQSDCVWNGAAAPSSIRISGTADVSKPGPPAVTVALADSTAAAGTQYERVG